LYRVFQRVLCLMLLALPSFERGECLECCQRAAAAAAAAAAASGESSVGFGVGGNALSTVSDAFQSDGYKTLPHTRLVNGAQSVRSALVTFPVSERKRFSQGAAHEGFEPLQRLIFRRLGKLSRSHSINVSDTTDFGVS
jgi:hypothetical protein